MPPEFSLFDAYWNVIATNVHVIGDVRIEKPSVTAGEVVIKVDDDASGKEKSQVSEVKMITALIRDFTTLVANRDVHGNVIENGQIVDQSNILIKNKSDANIEVIDA